VKNIEAAGRVLRASACRVIHESDGQLQRRGTLREQRSITEADELAIERLARDRETKLGADAGWLS
jgi:hypothetical protein